MVKFNYLKTWDQYNNDPNHTINDDNVYEQYHLLSYSDCGSNKLWQLAQYLINASEFRDILVVNKFNHWCHSFNVLSVPMNTDTKQLTKLNNLLNRAITRQTRYRLDATKRNKIPYKMVTYNLNLNVKMRDYLSNLKDTLAVSQFDFNYVDFSQVPVASQLFSCNLNNTWYSDVTIQDLIQDGTITAKMSYDWLVKIDCVISCFEVMGSDINYNIAYNYCNEIADLICNLSDCKWFKYTDH